MELKEKDDVFIYAAKLQERGARNALVSMAGDGAVLLTEMDRDLHATGSGKVVKSVGAGDSMVAGFLADIWNNMIMQKHLHGTVCGSASAFSEELATSDEVHALCA